MSSSIETELALARQVEELKQQELAAKDVLLTSRKESQLLQAKLQEERMEREKKERRESELKARELNKQLLLQKKLDPARSIKFVRESGRSLQRPHNLISHIPLHKVAYQWLEEFLQPRSLEEFSELGFVLFNQVLQSNDQPFKEAQKLHSGSEEFSYLYFNLEEGTLLGEEVWKRSFQKLYFSSLCDEWLTLPVVIGNHYSPINALQAHAVLTTCAIVGQLALRSIPSHEMGENGALHEGKMAQE